MTLRSPFLGRSVARQDPEAAALVEFTYHDYDGRTGWETLGDAEALAALSLEYPDNPHFLYELACRLINRAHVDPEILNRIADRLLQIDPANSRYYFLKACAVFYDWDENGAEKAVEYLEQCFSGSGPYDPYDFYKDRTCRLIEQEKPLLYFSDWATAWHAYDANKLRTLIQELLTYTQDLIVNGQSERALQLHDRLQRLAEDSIPGKIEYPWQNFWISFDPIGLFHPKTPQTVELQWMKIDPQRARQDRQQMLAWTDFSRDLRTKREKEKTVIPPSRWSEYWIPPAGHGFQMTLASLAGLAVFAGIGLIAGMRRSRLSVWSFVLAPLFFILYFLACRVSDYQQMHLCCGSHYTFDCVPSSWIVWALLCSSKPFAVYGLAAAFVIAAIIAMAYWTKRKRPGLFGRIILRLCAVLFVLSLWLAVSRLQFATLIFDLLVLLGCIPLLCFPLRNLRRKEYLPFLSRSAGGKEFRYRCLALCGYAAVFHLIGFTLSAPALAESIKAAFMAHKQERTWPTVIPNRYVIDPNSYPAFLSQFETADFMQPLGPLLAMVEPEDIPRVLTVLQERRKKEPNYFGGMMGPSMGMGMGMGMDSSMEALAQYNYLPGLNLDMEWCGRDAWPAIIPFVSDPNRIEMLLLREQTDDPAACYRMVELWRKYRGGSFELDKNLMQCFNRRQKGKLIEQWAAENKEIKSPYTALELLAYNAEPDPATQKWLWRQFIEGVNRLRDEEYFRDLTLASRPADYHISDDLLNECLSSKNERMRAMGQHIYQKTGKPLDEEILRRWAGDPHFLVRATVALRAPNLIGADEPSAFVRLVQELAQTGSTTK